MFGINSFDQVGQIVEGHYKEITKKENDLYDERIVICKECPLYSDTVLGPVCDSKKCWNKKENILETFPNGNNTCGCGCRLKAALRVKNKKCVLNKW